SLAPGIKVSSITALSNDIARALAALRTDRNAWRNRAEQSARAVATQVAQRTHAIYQELRRAQREVWTDPLTGLNNRRVLTDRLQAIFEAQRDAGQDLSIVMIDIDHFKNLNDTMGHLCGDELIKFTADLIRGSLRADDIAIRYGGDEFTLLLPGVGASEAAAVARRLTTLFGQRAMLFSGVSPRPSLSAGVASLRRNAPASAEELLSLADKALYEAKQAGRNQVALCGAGGAGK
ncbi:MAG: diguanylate cyclase, partial [Phycisphaerae bacterium]|nr:diguanylate cyclase [Phycisphaerae bacterium]